MNVTETLKEIFVNLFFIEPESIHPELTQADVENWDSMQHFNLIMAIQEDFGIIVSQEESVELLRFDKIVAFIETKLNT